MRIATWNVLHRVHAVNWREPAIDHHPAEAARIAAIAARAVTLADVVCLQEVSGDQLAALRAAAPDAAFAVHSYPRVPELFRPGPPPLADPTEHLVVIARLPIRAQRGYTFATDPGKGYLIVELDDMIVIDTHVSYGPHHATQCAELARAAGSNRVAVLGDFNADRDVCLRGLGGAFTACLPSEPALPTRPRAAPSDKSQTIDHILLCGLRARCVAVVSGDGLSDHNPVVARIE